MAGLRCRGKNLLRAKDLACSGHRPAPHIVGNKKRPATAERRQLKGKN